MMLERAIEADHKAIVELANLAYRGEGPGASWNTEAEFLKGERLSDASLKADLAAKPEAWLLTYRDVQDGPLLGTVWLEPLEDSVWYLGLLTVHPALQNRHLGRGLLTAAEEFVRGRGGRWVRMSVINLRGTLIAWYERRGYGLTGETIPFPYGETSLGEPMRADLSFVVLEKGL
jgi:ribosomal protein S18 acetylase RimI-like enzyme